MIDYERCAVCGAPVRTRHEARESAVVTTRWCSADPEHAYGTRGVRR